MKQTLKEFFSYNLVGIVNTLFGFSLIFTLMFLGISAVVANAIGYFFGAILSYYLNKKYTFKSKDNSHREAIKFFMVLGVSYLLNFLTLQWLLESINHYYAQLVSAIVYTLSSFILAKFFVFKDTNDL